MKYLVKFLKLLAFKDLYIQKWVIFFQLNITVNIQLLIYKGTINDQNNNYIFQTLQVCVI